MKNNKRYFQEASQDVHEKFNNAAGDFEAAGDNWEGFDDELMADGDGSEAQAAPTSQPYIINVTNVDVPNLLNVFILGANSNVLFAAPSFGNAAAVSITMGIPNITYQEFLFQTMSKPFLVALTYLQSSNATQILEAVTIRHKDSNGNLCDKPFIPIVDPYQQQTNVLAMKYLYTVDGLTTLTIATLYGSTTLKIYLYPADKIDLRRGLVGKGVQAQYSKPNVVNQQKVTISSSAIKKAIGQ